jgi:hypothetical protein
VKFPAPRVTDIPSTVLAGAVVAGAVVLDVVADVVVVVVRDAGVDVDDSAVPSSGIEGVVLLCVAT